MDPLTLNLLANIVIPEAIGVIRQYVQKTNGRWPTAAEVMAALPALADRTIDEGEAWLNRDKPAESESSTVVHVVKKTKPRKRKATKREKLASRHT